jgi:hypothetical protein
MLAKEVGAQAGTEAVAPTLTPEPAPVPQHVLAPPRSCWRTSPRRFCCTGTRAHPLRLRWHVSPRHYRSRAAALALAAERAPPLLPLPYPRPWPSDPLSRPSDLHPQPPGPHPGHWNRRWRPSSKARAQEGKDAGGEGGASPPPSLQRRGQQATCSSGGEDVKQEVWGSSAAAVRSRPCRP